MKRFLWCIALIIITAGIVAAQVKIKGTIYNSFGKKVSFGNVTVKPMVQIKPGPMPNYFKGEGQFEAELPNNGWYYVTFSSPNHFSMFQKIYADNANGDIIMTVRLSSYEYAEDLDKVAVMGDWNNFDQQTAEPMTRQSDGTYLFEKEFKGESLKYQLVNAEKNGRTINGTQSDSYEYDNDGDFRSVTSVTGNKIRIVFDPAKIQRGSGKLGIEFDAAHSYLNLIAEIDNMHKEISAEVAAEYKKYTDAGKDPKDFRYKPDMTKIVNYLSGLMNDPQMDNSIRRYAALSFLSHGAIYRVENKEQLVDKIIELLPFESDIWEIDPYSTFSFHSLVFNREFMKMNLSISEKWEKNQSKIVKAFGLVQRLQYLKNMQDAGSRQMYSDLYKELAGKYKDIDARLDLYINEYDPERILVPGKQVPDFSIKLLGSGKVVTREKMLGKYYLIDFWATWCGPCIGEMESLHKAFEKYKDKNFTILSLSLDLKEEDIAPFREKQYKMPWMHAFLEGQFGNKVVKDFNVSGIPQAFLVGPDGIILDVNNLRSSMLDQTIGSFVK